MKLQVVSAVLFSALAQTSGSGLTDASLDILVGDYSVRDTPKYNVCAPNAVSYTHLTLPTIYPV